MFRSASFEKLSRFDEAISDAEKCISLKPDWFQGFRRKGIALESSGKIEEAKEAYLGGLNVDPNNQVLKDHLSNLDGPKNNPFFGPDAMMKLMANE
jgi:stress-induced-phosphoprotein 1